MKYAPSNRALGTALGVDEKSVRKAEKAGRIQRLPGIGYDIEKCRKAWLGNTDPARSKVRTSVRTSADQGPQEGPQSAPSEMAPVRTPYEAREAVALVVRVLADEGVTIEAGEVDFAMARLAETILKARQRDLAIAERKRKLVPLAKVREHIEKSFIGIRQTFQRMPARHSAEMAAQLGADPGLVHKLLERMVSSTLEELSAPIVRG